MFFSKKNSDVDSDIFKVLFFFNISNAYKKTTYILRIKLILFLFWKKISFKRFLLDCLRFIDLIIKSIQYFDVFLIT